jgi:hypothetical protein
MVGKSTTLASLRTAHERAGNGGGKNPAGDKDTDDVRMHVDLLVRRHVMASAVSGLDVTADVAQVPQLADVGAAADDDHETQMTIQRLPHGAVAGFAESHG